jgi:hypothetical protein
MNELYERNGYKKVYDNSFIIEYLTEEILYLAKLDLQLNSKKKRITSINIWNGIKNDDELSKLIQVPS